MVPLYSLGPLHEWRALHPASREIRLANHLLRSAPSFTRGAFSLAGKTAVLWTEHIGFERHRALDGRFLKKLISPDRLRYAGLRSGKLLGTSLPRKSLPSSLRPENQEVLLITTNDKRNEKLSVRVYRIDDLVEWDADRFNASTQSFNARGDQLANIIVSCVARDSWSKNGTGEGAIHVMAPGMLVIGQTANEGVVARSRPCRMTSGWR